MTQIAATLKDFFLCDADEPLHWQDIALITFGVIVVSWTFVLGLAIMF